MEKKVKLKASVSQLEIVWTLNRFLHYLSLYLLFYYFSSLLLHYRWLLLLILCLLIRNCWSRDSRSERRKKNIKCKRKTRSQSWSKIETLVASTIAREEKKCCLEIGVFISAIWQSPSTSGLDQLWSISNFYAAPSWLLLRKRKKNNKKLKWFSLNLKLQLCCNSITQI